VLSIFDGGKVVCVGVVSFCYHKIFLLFFGISLNRVKLSLVGRKHRVFSLQGN
jgi:hypothetical protein